MTAESMVESVEEFGKKNWGSYEHVICAQFWPDRYSFAQFTQIVVWHSTPYSDGALAIIGGIYRIPVWHAAAVMACHTSGTIGRRALAIIAAIYSIAVRHTAAAMACHTGGTGGGRTLAIISSTYRIAVRHTSAAMASRTSGTGGGRGLAIMARPHRIARHTLRAVHTVCRMPGAIDEG
jgi:hypothetical protein